MLERRKKIELYNCASSTSLGYYTGDLFGIIPGVNTSWEERTPVGMATGGTHVEYLGGSDGVRGRE